MARFATSSIAAAAVLLSPACSGSGKGDAPDTAPPSISIDAPNADDTVTAATVTLRARVDDAGGVASVEYAANAGSFAPLPSVSGAYQAEVPLPLDDGVPFAFTVRARDRAGNEASATRSFRVDRVPPRVSIDGVDASCAEACTGAVVRAADGPFHLAGTATDGSGVSSVLVIVRDDGGTEVASAYAGVDGAGAFGWDWSWNLPVDGRFFTIAVRADDPKGNSGFAERVVYVDDVIPTVAAGPATPAPRTGTLVTFSEPMVASSVAAATALALADSTPVPAALSWVDARSFGFTAQLDPFTGYRIDIGAGATDRAGNPLAAWGTSFETEMIPPPAGPSVAAAAAAGARRPRIGVLGDGRPVAVYGTSGKPHAVRWDGRGSWADEEISNAALSGGVAVDLDMSFSGTAALFAVPNGAVDDLYFARASGTSSWTGWSGGAEDLLAKSVLSAWPAAFGVQCLMGPPCQQTALFGDAGGARYVRRDAVWSAPNLVKATAAGAGAIGGGNAFVDDKVYYLDTWLGPPSTDPPFYLAVTNALAGVGHAVGAEAWRTSDAAYRATPFVAFTTPRAGADPAADDLHLACLSATPWRSAVKELTATADDLALALSSSTVAVGVALAGGGVLFGSAPNGVDQCLTDPAPVWEQPILGAKEPAVAVGWDGTTVWKAWIASNGDLVVAR